MLNRRMLFIAWERLIKAVNGKKAHREAKLALTIATDSDLTNSKRADHTVSPFFMLSLPQRLTHRGTGVCFRHGIEVAIDVGDGARIAVSEPFPNLLHRYALVREAPGRRRAQVVEADLLQLMLLQMLSRVPGYEVGK